MLARVRGCSAAVTRSYIDDASHWQKIEGTRATSLLSLLAGVGGVGLSVLGIVRGMTLAHESFCMVTALFAGVLCCVVPCGARFTAGLTLVPLRVVPALFGFISMCVWASFANNEEHEYGASFIVIILSWIAFAAASACAVWERGDGIPDAVKRAANVGASRGAHGASVARARCGRDAITLSVLFLMVDWQASPL